MVDDEAEGTIKVLVLTELSTNCVGYVIVGQETRTVKNQICKWLDHFGLASSTSSVVLHTDAERAVSELFGTSSDKYTFLVRRARPQQHQSNGGAERAVRRLKESLAVLRAEMNQGGADVCFTERGLHDVVTYIALSHNHFSKAPGTDFSHWSTLFFFGRRPLPFGGSPLEANPWTAGIEPPPAVCPRRQERRPTEPRDTFPIGVLYTAEVVSTFLCNVWTKCPY